MDRERVLRSLFDTTGYGLEIGASYNPLLPKSAGFNVKTLDHADQAQLIAKYGATGQATDRIEPVDYVSDGRPMRQVIGGSSVFDFIFASHVIEHTTDFLAFLQDCESLLRPGGKLVLAVPDRRFCFDFFRPVSSTGQIIEAHLQGRTRHSPATVFDYLTLVTTRGGEIAWQRPQLGPFATNADVNAAFEQTKAFAADGEYHDMHGWTFTPSSFRYHIKVLGQLGLIGLGEERLQLTNGFEFYVVLSRQGTGPSEPLSELLMDAAAEILDVTMPGDRADGPGTDWQASYNALVNSRSWRVTAPLRALGRLVRRGRRR